MKEVLKDTARMLVCTVPLYAALAFGTWMKGDADRTRYAEAERHSAAMLAEAERHNADMHARSATDRATIHEIQEDVRERLSALERAKRNPTPGGDQ